MVKGMAYVSAQIHKATFHTCRSGSAGSPDNGAAPIKCATGKVLGLSIGYDGDSALISVVLMSCLSSIITTSCLDQGAQLRPMVSISRFPS